MVFQKGSCHISEGDCWDKMIKEDKILIRSVIKCMTVLALSIAACRFTSGYFAVVMAVLGIGWALSNRIGRALACYAFFPLLIVLDQGILQQTEVSGIVLRISPLIIGLTLFAMANTRPGDNMLPFGSLFVYLFLSTISSMNGWCPKISYMKIVNFIVFLVGIWVGTKNLQNRPQEIYKERVFFLSLASLIVLGSLAVMPFPAISYSTNLKSYGITTQAEAVVQMAELAATGGISLFSGILNQSQALAPILSCCIALVLSDMLFIEKRITSFHSVVIALGFIELYMTRSRTGLFSCAVGLFMVLVHSAKRLNLSIATRAKIKKMTSTGIVLLVALIVAGEISNHTITKWVYKSNDLIGTQEADFGEALTSSRQGLIDLSFEEFKMNPWLGMGFQVNYETNIMYGNKGFALSAPVEKGLLPMMILGEGGVLGSIAFAVFLICFYTACARKKLHITIAMFTTFLATNIGEATFFSPGGIGGILWMICVVGGFALDTMMLSVRQQERLAPYNGMW